MRLSPLRPAVLRPYLIVILGAAILAFGLYHVHSQSTITEGGVLGMTLFLQHWLNLSPSVSGVIMDALCYLIGFRFLGWAFARYSITASISFSLFYRIFEQFPPLFPNIAEHPLLAAVLGALFVGIGVGLAVRIGGACVSEKHAGFVVNTGGATCADITALMDHVRAVVLSRTGVELEPEVRLVR